MKIFSHHRLFVLLVLLCAMIWAVQVDAANITRIDIDPETLDVSIEGTVDSAEEGALVTIEVINPQKSVDDIDETSPEKAIEVFNRIAMARTQADGTWSITYNLKEAGGDSGSYTVRAKGPGRDALIEKSFSYYTQEDMQKTYHELNGYIAEGNDSKISEMLQDPQVIEKLSLSFPALEGICEEEFLIPPDFADSTAKIMAAEKSAIEGYDIVGMQSLFRGAALTELLNRATASEIQALLELEDGTLNITYLGYLGLENTSTVETFIQYDAPQRQNIYSSTANFHTGGGRYQSIADAAFGFSDCVVSKEMKQLNGWSAVDEFLTKYKDVLNLPMDSYNATNVSKQQTCKAILNAMVSNRIKNIEDLRRHFSSCIVKETTGGGSSGGGSTGGGTGGFGGSPSKSNSSPTMSIYAPTDSPSDSMQTDPLQPTKEFSDIDGIAWAEKSIVKLANDGILEGYPDGTFRPDDQVTREQFIKILVEALDLKNPEASSKFTDVPPECWSYPYISQAYALGIINGVSENEFGAQQPITRQDMAVITARALQKIGIPMEGEATEFADQDEIASYAFEAVLTMRAAGILTGMDDGAFYPNQTATRAQTAVMIERMMQLKQNGNNEAGR